jgi:hypothetical protein
MSAGVSACCGGPLEARGRVTRYYVCGTCGKPCNAATVLVSRRRPVADPVRLSPASLEDRIGWELHTAGGIWKAIVDVIPGERNVLVVTEDRTLYTYQRTDGVKVRPPEAEDEGAGREA